MNFLTLIIAIVRYKFSYDKHDSIISIKNMLIDGGPIWQKFAQMLSGFGDLIGEDLAYQLEDTLYDCSAHEHIYSNQILYQTFGEKYNFDSAIYIGSGTIAQTYKIDNIIVKILHPDILHKINVAIYDYENTKKSFLFPTQYTNICDIFFYGLRRQCNMKQEYENGVLFYRTFNSNNSLYIIPKMIEYSTECLIMTYEESLLVAEINNNIPREIQLKLYNGILFFHYICILNGFVHMDLHLGNCGIRNNTSFTDMKIVIYDFGLVNDVSKIPEIVRRKMVESYIYYDSTLFSWTFFNEIYKCGCNKFKCNNYDCFKKGQRILVLNSIHNSNHYIDINYCFSKNIVIIAKRDEISNNHEIYCKQNIIQYIDTHFSYLEFDILRCMLTHKNDC